MCITFKLLLTDGVDVKEAHRCPEYGVKHAVVQRLCALHQYVEQDQIPDKAKKDGSCSQTCRNQQQIILLYTTYSAGDLLNRVNDDMCFQITSVNSQVEV